jgi:branched-chain amino acid transport system permease protein
MPSQILLNGIISGSIYILIALGFAIVYRTVKFFHFAHGAVYAVGAYIGYALMVHGGIPSVVSFLAAALGSGAVGVCTDRIVYWPLRKRRAPDMVFLIASFGVFVFIQNLLQLVFGAQTLSIRMGVVKVGHQFFNAVITDAQILILVVSGLLSVGLWVFVRQAKLGKAMRAVADDRLGASVAGIDPEQVVLAAFAIGSVLAGAAGVLVAYETNIEPTMGMNAILKGIIASIVGGIGSIPGAVLGGLFLGLAENIGIWKISAGWKDSIAFAILIVFLLIRPGGIMGVKVRGEQL